MSPLQEGVLFHCILEPDSQLYLEQAVFEIAGVLEWDICRQAWQAIVQANEVLRTCFAWEETPGLKPYLANSCVSVKIPTAPILIPYQE